MVACAGTQGFFRPRIPNPWFYPRGAIEATSYFDTRPLKATLERFVDFDRMNADKKDVRLSLGAVNVRSGNLVYTLLAVVIVPMILVTLNRARLQRFELHKKIARWTWPLWMYVSVTGVVVYWLLYVQFPQKQ